MPVVRQRAFLILFAGDYVNSRYRVKAEEPGEPGGGAEEGLLLTQGASSHPLWKECIFCRWAEAFDGWHTVCWKQCREENILPFADRGGVSGLLPGTAPGRVPGLWAAPSRVVLEDLSPCSPWASVRHPQKEKAGALSPRPPSVSSWRNSPGVPARALDRLPLDFPCAALTGGDSQCVWLSSLCKLPFSLTAVSHSKSSAVRSRAVSAVGSVSADVPRLWSGRLGSGQGDLESWLSYSGCAGSSPTTFVPPSAFLRRGNNHPSSWEGCGGKISQSVSKCHCAGSPQNQRPVCLAEGIPISSIFIQPNSQSTKALRSY